MGANLFASKTGPLLLKAVELRLIRQPRRLTLHKPDQWTMFTAIAGVIESVVFLPAGKIRIPKITPTRLLKLYSIAGASPKYWPEPELSRIG